MTTHDQHATFADLLRAAVEQPGRLHRAYFAFHGYSIGNRLLSFMQCTERGIAPGPIASFNKWKERGRCVQKGQKAIALWMPITVRRTVAQDGSDAEDVAFTRFLLKRNWFVLSQTQGQDYTPEPIATWDRASALQMLGIEQIAFDHIDGNVWLLLITLLPSSSPLVGCSLLGLSSLPPGHHHIGAVRIRVRSGAQPSAPVMQSGVRSTLALRRFVRRVAAQLRARVKQ
jgi:hypothetical protein